jgi:hypothetical protein
MKTDTIKPPADAAEATLFLGDDWFDPLETGVRTRIRGFIEELLEAELDAALGRDRYERPRLAETCVGGRAVNTGTAIARPSLETPGRRRTRWRTPGLSSKIAIFARALLSNPSFT